MADGKATAFQKSVYLACARIPEGKVSTYSDIALAIGKPGAARAVGNALNKNRSPTVPCHRVIRSDRSVGGFARGTRMKVAMQRREGVVIVDGKVSENALFHPPTAQPSPYGASSRSRRQDTR
jgi:methylated-DNA-[protein]-cysteine S-methyltransferase